MSTFERQDQRPPSFPSYYGLYANYLNPVPNPSLYIQNFNQLSHTNGIPCQPSADEIASHPTASIYTTTIPNQHWVPPHDGNPFYLQSYDMLSSHNSLGEARFSERLAQDSIQGNPSMYTAPSTLTSPGNNQEIDHAISKSGQLSPDGTPLIIELSSTDEQPQFLPSPTDDISGTGSSTWSGRVSPNIGSKVTDRDLAAISIVSVGGGAWKCKKCDKIFRRKRRALIHYLNKHRGVRLGCNGACGVDGCDKTFAAQEGLDMHLNPVETKCPTCGRSLLRKNVIRHKRSHCHPS